MNSNLRKKLDELFDKHELELNLKWIDFEMRIKKLYKPIEDGLRYNGIKHLESN